MAFRSNNISSLFNDLFFSGRRDVNHACFDFDSAESVVLNFNTLVILS